MKDGGERDAFALPMPDDPASSVVFTQDMLRREG